MSITRFATRLSPDRHAVAGQIATAIATEKRRGDVAQALPGPQAKPVTSAA